MSEQHEISNTVSFGGHSVEFDSVPRHVQIGFFARTFAHKLGNEVDAAVVSRCRNAIGDPKATLEQVSEFRTSHPDEVSAWQKELRDRLVEKILNGSVGIRESNGKSKPAVDPVEDRFHQLVIDEMRPTLKAFKYTKTKRPNLADSVTDSFGKTISLQALYDAIATTEGHPFYKGADLRKQAERDVAAGARKAQRQAGLNLAEVGF